MSEPLYPCPACGFLVFDSPHGSYDICPLCDWEDDGIQLRFPNLRVGANNESLYEWQQRWLGQLPMDVCEHQGFVRDKSWRLVGPEEFKSGGPITGKQYFDVIDEEFEPYWKKGPG